MDIKEKIYRKYINLRVNLKYFLLQRPKANAIGHEYINKNITDEEYSQLCDKLYGNKYLEQRYEGDYEKYMENKRQLARLVSEVLNPSNRKMKICDAGANKGYLMKAFLEMGGIYETYGFDILDDVSKVVESTNDVVRKNYKLGSVLNIPEFDTEFDIVTCINVFEHIPINKTGIMAQQLLKLRPEYFVFEISRDIFCDGHITLKGTKFWTRKFKGYRVMKELKPILREKLPLYEYCGVPRNGWNKSPGIVFLEKVE